MISREVALVLIGVVVSLLGGYSYLVINDDIVYTNVWMISNVLYELALLVAFRLVVKEHKLQVIISMLCFLTFGELIDELFFDPIVFSWNELIVLIITGVYGYLKLCKKKQS